MESTDDLLVLAISIEGYGNVSTYLDTMEKVGVIVPYSLRGQVRRTLRDLSVAWLGVMGSVAYTDADLKRAVVEAQTWVQEHAMEVEQLRLKEQEDDD